MEGNFQTIILQEVGSLGFGTSRDPLGTVLGRVAHSPLVRKGVNVTMPTGPRHWADWEAVLINWHFNSLLELEYRGRWMKLPGQEGRKKFLVL